MDIPHVVDLGGWEAWEEVIHPSSDPQIAEMERLAAEFYIQRMFAKPPMRDCLPEHYREAK